jgi:hypothetical protein
MLSNDSAATYKTWCRMGVLTDEYLCHVIRVVAAACPYTMKALDSTTVGQKPLEDRL